MKANVDAKQCFGIDLQWDCAKTTLDCSMDECIETALNEFEHALSKQIHHAPSEMIRPNCGAKVQCVEDDTSKALAPEQIERMQKVIGEFPFSVRAGTDTMLRVLNELACQVATGTEHHASEAADCLLNCIASTPKPRIRCQASDVIPQVNSDAAFHVCPQALADVITLDPLTTTHSMHLSWQFQKSRRMSWEAPLKQKWQSHTQMHKKPLQLDNVWKTWDTLGQPPE